MKLPNVKKIDNFSTNSNGNRLKNVYRDITLTRVKLEYLTVGIWIDRLYEKIPI